LETWNARIMGPALETLRGLGSMSEREFEAAVASFANPNMTLGAALSLVDEQIAKAERQTKTARAANDFMADAGGLTGRRNAQGQDWPAFLEATLRPPQQAQPQQSRARRRLVQNWRTLPDASLLDIDADSISPEDVRAVQAELKRRRDQRARRITMSTGGAVYQGN
jgi:hypothetical protein